MALSGAARKRKGARRELQARKFLEDRGYLVTKAGGSLGAFDLVAVNETATRLIQVKSNRPPAKPERVLLQSLARELEVAKPEYKRTVELWIFKDGYKYPEITIL